MAKYAMRIIETLSRTVIVDADDLDEATDKARSAYDSNEVILEADDFEKCEIIPASWTKMELFQMEEIQSFSHTFLVKQILAFTIFTGMHLITK